MPRFGDDGLFPPRGAAARAVVLCAMGVNLLASVLMATVMKGATAAGGPAAQRMRFIAQHHTVVSLGWGSWVLATLGLLTVVACTLRSLDEPRLRAVRVLAMTTLVIGSIPDMINNLIGAAVLPAISVRALAAPEGSALRAALEVDFLAWDRFSVMLTGFLANGLYAATLAVTTWLTFRHPGFPRRLAWVGVPLSASTLGIAVASAIDSATLLVASVGSTMALFCVWATGIALLWLGRGAR